MVPLEIAKVDPDPIYLTEGDLLADHQVEHIDAQIRFAIDDMFMITSLQVQAYRVFPFWTEEEQTHRDRHLDTAAETMVLYLDTMQEDNGLFPHHRDNAAFRISWGRGNGWYAAGMAEMIRELPLDHPEHGGINEGYMKMMTGLLQYPIPEGQPGAGLWKQVVVWPRCPQRLVGLGGKGQRPGPNPRHQQLGLLAVVHEGGPSFSGDEENYYFQGRETHRGQPRSGSGDVDGRSLGPPAP